MTALFNKEIAAKKQKIADVRVRASFPARTLQCEAVHVASSPRLRWGHSFPPPHEERSCTPPPPPRAGHHHLRRLRQLLRRHVRRPEAGVHRPHPETDARSPAGRERERAPRGAPLTHGSNQGAHLRSRSSCLSALPPWFSLFWRSNRASTDRLSLSPPPNRSAGRAPRPSQGPAALHGPQRRAPPRHPRSQCPQEEIASARNDEYTGVLSPAPLTRTPWPLPRARPPQACSPPRRTASAPRRSTAWS